MLDKNLEALISVNPKLTANIMAIKENREFEVFLDENDRLNYNIYNVKKDEFFYENSPIKTVTEQYEEMEKIYSRYPYLYLYGLDNGVLIKLLANKENIERILVIEPSIELFYIVFNLLDFSKEIKDKKIVFEYSKDFSFIKADEYIEGNAKIYAKIYELKSFNQYYYKYYSEEIVRISDIFSRAITHVVTSIGNSSTDSILGLKNHILNLPFMLKTPNLKDSSKKFKNSETAIVVSTGPSLYKQLELLKKYQDYVTIFCVDASLPILQEHRIKPDIVFTIERVKESAKFYENLDKEFLKDTVFEVTSLVDKELLKHIEDMNVQMSIRPFRFLRYFEFNEWGHLGFGMSAANMAFEGAYLFGFKKIVLIGQDLSYSKDGKSHSKGHVFGEDEIKTLSSGVYIEKKSNTIKESEILLSDDFYIEGYYGDKVLTTKIWNMFLNFFEKHIESAKEDDAITYNCTEGGAKIKGAEHISFEEYFSKYVDISKKKETIKLPKPKGYKKNIKKAHKKVEDLLKYAEEVKKQVEETFLDVMKKIEELEILNEENRLNEISFDVLNETLNKIDKIKEIYESEKFGKVFYEATMSFILHEEMELAKIMVKNVETDEEKKAKIVDWIYEHKSWLFFLAGGLESIETVVKESYEKWEDEK